MRTFRTPICFMTLMTHDTRDHTLQTARIAAENGANWRGDIWWCGRNVVPLQRRKEREIRDSPVHLMRPRAPS